MPMINIYHLDDEIRWFERYVKPACYELRRLFEIDAEPYLICPQSGSDPLLFDDAGNRVHTLKNITYEIGPDALLNENQLQPILRDKACLVLLDVSFGDQKQLSVYGLNVARYLVKGGVEKERIILFTNYVERAPVSPENQYWWREPFSKGDFPPQDGAERLAIRLRAKCVEAALEVPPLSSRIPTNVNITISPDHNDAFNKCVEIALGYAESKAPVLIMGETGSGKEHMARLLHYCSPRKNGPYVVVDCTALADNLIESELFGHEKGAFTDARSEKPGQFELANDGTVFLDEIGELPFPLQGKLLRVLDGYGFKRLGGQKELKPNIRIVAATNRDLRAMVEMEQFRDDLFWRLDALPLRVPALRERPTHIPLLADAFLKPDYPLMMIMPEAMQALMHCDWPGNVRQLRNVIARACILSSSTSAITLEVIQSCLREQRGIDSIPTETIINSAGSILGKDGSRAPLSNVRVEWTNESTALAARYKKKKFLVVIRMLLQQHKDPESCQKIIQMVLLAVRFACDKPQEAKRKDYLHANALLKLVGLIGYFADAHELSTAEQERLIIQSGALNREIPDWNGFDSSVGKTPTETWQGKELQHLLSLIKEAISEPGPNSAMARGNVK